MTSRDTGNYRTMFSVRKQRGVNLRGREALSENESLRVNLKGW